MNERATKRLPCDEARPTPRQVGVPVVFGIHWRVQTPLNARVVLYARAGLGFITRIAIMSAKLVVMRLTERRRVIERNDGHG